MVIRRTVDPIDHRRADPEGCMFLMRTHRLGLVFFAVAMSLFTGKPSPPCSTIRKWSCLNPVVYRCWPLSNLADDVNRVLWFPSRAITQMHQALNDRLMMPLAT